MSNEDIREDTRKLLEQSPLPGEGIDMKVRQLLKSEYIRMLARYQRVDFLMTQKYGMTFDEFVNRRIVRQKEYGWDVESDAMEWETAISGMKSIKSKLQKLQEPSVV